MNLSAIGETLIKSFEQFRAKAYQDEGGIWTAGWGHTGPDVVEGTTCTDQQAQDWFLADVREAVRVNQELPCNQYQFDAVVSFTFNVGIGAEQHSTLVKLIHAGDMDGAANEFLKWNHVNGKVSAGLTRRRQAERDLFVTPMPPPAPGDEQ